MRNHDVIFPQLFDYVAENGVLAVQMPDNHNEHTHRILRQMAKLDQWKEKLSKTNEELEVLMSPTQYYDLLSTKVSNYKGYIGILVAALAHYVEKWIHAELAQLTNYHIF